MNLMAREGIRMQKKDGNNWVEQNLRILEVLLSRGRVRGVFGRWGGGDPFSSGLEGGAEER